MPPAEPNERGARGPGMESWRERGAAPWVCHRDPRFGQWRAERQAMLREQLLPRGVTDEAVLAALLAVPRHAFVPADLQPSAYDDGPLPLRAGQTISQPCVVAAMTEAAGLCADSRVLELGTGSGYQTAVLAEITPHVHSIEIVPELAASAARLLDELGYRTLRMKRGDGHAGWPEAAPFDAILVAAAASDVPPALVSQLAPGGRLVLPLGPADGVQQLTLIEKDARGQRTRRVIDRVRFVPFTGG